MPTLYTIRANKLRQCQSWEDVMEPFNLGEWVHVDDYNRLTLDLEEVERERDRFSEDLREAERDAEEYSATCEDLQETVARLEEQIVDLKRQLE